MSQTVDVTYGEATSSRQAGTWTYAGGASSEPAGTMTVPADSTDFGDGVVWHTRSFYLTESSKHWKWRAISFFSQDVEDSNQGLVTFVAGDGTPTEASPPGDNPFIIRVMSFDTSGSIELQIAALDTIQTPIQIGVVLTVASSRSEGVQTSRDPQIILMSGTGG